MHGPSIAPIVAVPMYFPLSAGTDMSPTVPAPCQVGQTMNLLLVLVEENRKLT